MKLVDRHEGRRILEFRPLGKGRKVEDRKLEVIWKNGPPVLFWSHRFMNRVLFSLGRPGGVLRTRLIESGKNEYIRAGGKNGATRKHKTYHNGSPEREKTSVFFLKSETSITSART